MSDSTTWQSYDDGVDLDALTDLDIEERLGEDETGVIVFHDEEPLINPEDPEQVAIARPRARTIGDHRVIEFHATITLAVRASE